VTVPQAGRLHLKSARLRPESPTRRRSRGVSRDACRKRSS
jgi:hypothetical protein